jgi:hypothetical protein
VTAARVEPWRRRVPVVILGTAGQGVPALLSGSGILFSDRG